MITKTHDIIRNITCYLIYNLHIIYSLIIHEVDNIFNAEYQYQNIEISEFKYYLLL